MKLVYNERSWAIEVCTEINIWASRTTGPIKTAGGEQGARDTDGMLFPDVLLFGDGARALVIQGWELKFPDTSIDDQDLLANAHRKAQALGLASFLVWNVNDAVLYKLEGDSRQVVKIWHLNMPTSRPHVQSSSWREMLTTILEDVSEYFVGGQIRLTSPLETFSASVFSEFVSRHTGATRDSLAVACASNPSLRDQISMWWADHSHEHSSNDELEVLAGQILISWLSKFLLAHAIRKTSVAASLVDSITQITSAEAAGRVFSEITSRCDFQNVFGAHLAEETIAHQSWIELVEINQLLGAVRIRDTDPAVLQQLLNIPHAASRKFAGQYATPVAVARLLVALGSLSVDEDFIDPCVGTGTIARVAYREMRALGASSARTTEKIWASDKFSSPLRLATLALSTEENRSLVLNVFQHDASLLQPGETISLMDPDTGQHLSKSLPLFGSIVSNPPFVKQELVDRLNADLRNRVNDVLDSVGGRLAGKSDLFAYLPFSFFQLLKPDGNLVLITSNSWLATEWGLVFIELLERFYEVRAVVISGEGRWFKEVKISTTILVLKRRPAVVASSSVELEITNFCVLEDSIERIIPDDNPLEARLLAAHIKTGKSEPGRISIHRVPTSKRRALAKAGISTSTLFADTTWLDRVLPLLCKINSQFDVSRGERRGWDAMFFPDPGHGIESEYLVPVVISPRTIGLTARPDGWAFCCDRPVDSLEALGHDGALAWISRFEHARNTSGQPLRDVLARRARRGDLWYQMRSDAVADLVLPMNPNTRLFVSLLSSRSLVNQRLIALRAKTSTDVSLCHAILNSSIGLFLIESAGFGRGEGVLDLRSDTVKHRMSMLDPERIQPADREEIVARFAPLVTRDVRDLSIELDSEDRHDFDASIARAFGLSDEMQAARAALNNLVKIRQQASIA